LSLEVRKFFFPPSQFGLLRLSVVIFFWVGLLEPEVVLYEKGSLGDLGFEGRPLTFELVPELPVVSDSVVFKSFVLIRFRVVFAPSWSNYFFTIGSRACLPRSADQTSRCFSTLGSLLPVDGGDVSIPGPLFFFHDLSVFPTFLICLRGVPSDFIPCLPFFEGFFTPANPDREQTDFTDHTITPSDFTF